MIFRLFLVFILLFAIIIAKGFANPIPKRTPDSDFRPKYGVSYSFEQAKWYGVDPRAGYAKLLDEVKPDWVRLPFFWDQMTDSEGNLKIDGLKFAIEEAGKRNVKVVIVLGAKTPYYPETHFPIDIKNRVKFGERISADHPIANELLLVDKKLVEELSSYKNISYWQVENEPMLSDQRGVSVDLAFVKAEIAIVKSTDHLMRPVIVNHPAGWLFARDWQKVLGLLEKGDVYSTNAYFKTQGTNLAAFKILEQEIRIPWPSFLTWPVQPWPFLSPDYAKWKKTADKKGIGFWIMEMQAEPYIRELSDAQKNNFSYTASDILASDRYLKSFGIKSIGLWGANFWQYRDKKGDRSWIEAIKSITLN